MTNAANPGGGSRNDAREIAARALDAAKRTLASVSNAEALVRVDRSANANVRYARNEITTSGEGEALTLQLWMGVGPRHARVTSNQVDDASLAKLAERALTMARLAPEDPEKVPLLPPQTYGAASAFDPALAHMGPGDRAAVAAHGIAEADKAKVAASGFWHRGAFETAIASTSGLRAAHAETWAAYTVTARTRDGKGSGWAGAEDHRANGIDDTAVARRAIEKSLRSAAAQPLPPGKYTVILEPAAVAEMLGFLVEEMDQRSADEGRSFFAGKVGQKVFADGVSLTSDPTGEGTPAMPFDGDGVPLAARKWIDAGKVESLYVSRFWAAKHKIAATGSASVYRLAPGNGGSVDDLVKATKRGLLVTRFWYTRMLEPQSIMLTGLTRDGVFLVEDGKITRAVSNFRYNESPVNVLKNVEAIGDKTYRVPAYGSATWHVPALRTREFTMASTSAAV